MPSDARLCLFGDSHIACVKQALDGMDPPPEIALWGVAGNRFRQLVMQDGALQAGDAETAARVADVAGADRPALRPGDFDVVFFLSARVRVHRVFMELLSRPCRDTGHLSAAMSRAYVAEQLRQHAGYGWAAEFARAGEAEIVFMPAPLETDGIAEVPDRFAPGLTAGRAEREAVWTLIADVMDEDGIVLAPQPEATIARGFLTAGAYAAEGAAEARDPAHKNAAFGALVVQAALDFL